MRSVRTFMLAALSLVLMAMLQPWSMTAQEIPATPAATPMASPIALGAAECTVDPIDPVAYGEAVRAATSVENPPALETGQLADPETTAAVRETIEVSIACSNAGDMARLLTLTDPAFAPAMLSTDRAEIQPEIDRAVNETPAEGQAGPPLIEEGSGQEVSATLLAIGDVVSFPDGTAAIQMELDSPQTNGVATATAWLRPTDEGWVVTTWSI